MSYTRITTKSTLTKRHRNPISFVVQPRSNFGQIAVSLDFVLDRARFHEKSVRFPLFFHPVHTLFVVVHHHCVAVRLHHAPHLLVQIDVGILNRKHVGMKTPKQITVAFQTT